VATGAPAELIGVTRRFGATVAVDDVSFDLRPGEVLGLLGPNGAGKTTTMRMLTGYLRPSAGRVLVDGIDLATDPVACKRLVGYMPEASALYPEMTVEGYLRFWARLRSLPRKARRPAVAKALGRAGLHPVARRPIGTLSHGYRQRVSLAQALLHDPAVLVLDEPTAGLDPRHVVETRELIGKLARTRTVLLSSHLLSEVAMLCKRVVVLDRGRLVAVDEVARLTAGDGRIRVEVRVRGDVDAAVRAVRAVEGVGEAASRGAVVVVDGEGDGLQERVAAAVVAAGVGLVELKVVSSGSLEDAYLKLVRR
jgi:ABC-2 type transport system ATP-binding protein